MPHAPIPSSDPDQRDAETIQRLMLAKPRPGLRMLLRALLRRIWS